jgi:uncharacterized protein YkwD
MSRPSLRRTPMLESLEARQVLSSIVGPTADQQYALEVLNLVRTDPSAAGDRLTSSLSPVVQSTLDHYGLKVSNLQAELRSATPQPPLAWSDSLGSTAQAQSQYEADHGVQTHQGQGEASLSDRITGAGYSNFKSYGENTFAYADSTDEAMQSFLFDWGVSDAGHYRNLLQPGTPAEGAYKDVGIGLVNTSGNGVGPLVLTQDFGSQQGQGPQILGVVYDDPNNTGFYAPGEGQGGVTIDALNLGTGKDYQTQSFGSGGYQVPVAGNADYKVTATENGHTISSQQIHVGDVNAKVDFVHNPANDQAPPATQASVPSDTPAPVVWQAPVAPQAPVTPQSAPVHVAAQFLVSVPPQQDQSSGQDQPTTTQAASTPATPTVPAWLSRWSRWTVAKHAN